MTGEAELRLREQLARLRRMPLLGGVGLRGDRRRFEQQLERIKEQPTDDEIWEKVELARHEARPYTLDYVERLLEDFVELHGDRGRADDPALVTAINGMPRSQDESQARENFSPTTLPIEPPMNEKSITASSNG